MGDEITFKCARIGCSFATFEPYNYCPHCGLELYKWVNGQPQRSQLNENGPDSGCPMAADCASMGNYHVDACEQGEVPKRCLSGILSMQEGTRHELRLLRKAFEDSRILAPRSTQVSRDVQSKPAKNTGSR